MAKSTTSQPVSYVATPFLGKPPRGNLPFRAHSLAIYHLELAGERKSDVTLDLLFVCLFN